MTFISPVRPVRVAKVVTAKRDTRGRPASFEKKIAVAEVLRGMRQVSRFHMIQLVKAGYVTPVAVKSGGRGRPSFTYDVTSKGRNLVNLSSNWAHFRNVAKSVETVEITADDEATMIESYEAGMSDQEALDNFADACEGRAELQAQLAAEFGNVVENCNVAEEMHREFEAA